MATYNLCQENNQQNEMIFNEIWKTRQGIEVIIDRESKHHFSLMNAIEIHMKKTEELHNTECNKLDRMIALLEKIAGEGE